MNRPLAALSVALYAACILGANYLTSTYGLVPVGFGLLVTAGTYAAGLALLARDLVQRTAGLPLTIAAMILGVILSWLLADPHIAVASAVAFAAAEAIDLLVFTPVNARAGWGRAALLSNLCSAPVDTLVFLAIAGFPITAATVTGQLVGKLVWATLVPLAVYAAVRWLIARQRPTVAA